MAWYSSCWVLCPPAPLPVLHLTKSIWKIQPIKAVFQGASHFREEAMRRVWGLLVLFTAKKRSLSELPAGLRYENKHPEQLPGCFCASPGSRAFGMIPCR